jgi:hypothetical protein
MGMRSRQWPCIGQWRGVIGGISHWRVDWNRSVKAGSCGEFILEAKRLQMPKEKVLEACRTAGKGTYLSYGVTLSSFTCFQRLPLELRCKIWTEAHPRPRTLFVRRTCYGNVQLSDAQEALDQRSPFGHLLVNREARHMFLKCGVEVMLDVFDCVLSLRLMRTILSKRM